MAFSPYESTASSLKIATVAMDKASLDSLREAVKTLAVIAPSDVFGSFPADAALNEFLQQLRSRSVDVCVIDFDADRTSAVATAEFVRDRLPGVALFAASSNPDPEVIIQCMHLGCTEYLIKPFAKERVVQALVRLDAKRREKGTGSEGKIYAILGSKGGTGVTTLCAHLASYCSQMGAKTLLIDQHSDLGDLSVYLTLGVTRYHFFELVNNSHRLDPELLKGFLIHHESGLDVLPSPETFGLILQPSPTALQHTLNFLRGLYQVIIIDCPPGLNGTNVTAIEAANAVFLVATPELVAIRNMSRYLDHLKRYNCPESKIKIVLNRYSKHAAITRQQVEKAIQRDVSLTVPNSYPDIISAIHSGQPMAFDSRSELVTSLRNWAGSLAETSESEVRREVPRRRGILGLI